MAAPWKKEKKKVENVKKPKNENTLFVSLIYQCLKQLLNLLVWKLLEGRS